MLELVHTIFMAKNLAISIATYFKLMGNVDAKVNKLVSKEFNSAIGMLEQAKHISNPTIYGSMLVTIIDRFNQALTLKKRERLLLSYLGLMISYYYLGEKEAIAHIQQIVSQQQFKFTFLEKYGGDIEEAGLTILGTLGGGGIIAAGNQIGRSMRESTEKEMRERELKFNELRDSIVTLRFAQNLTI